MIDRTPLIAPTVASFREADRDPYGPNGIDPTFVKALFERSRNRPIPQDWAGLFVEAALDMVSEHRSAVEQHWRSKGRKVMWSGADYATLARKFAASLPRTKAVQAGVVIRLHELRTSLLSNETMTINEPHLSDFDNREPIERTINRSLDYIEYCKGTARYDRLFPLYRELTCMARVMCAMFGSSS